MNALKSKLLAVTALTLLAAPAYAQTANTTLETYEDESPIVLSGTVADVSDEEFTMAYDGGTVTVDMEDWDWFSEEQTVLNTGDDVVVSGQIDDDLFSGREIEADSVYLVTDSAYYYGDEQTDQPVYYLSTFDAQNRQNQQQNQQQAQAGTTGTTGATDTTSATGQTATRSPMPRQSWVSAVGTVQNIDDQQMTLDAGRYNLVVDIEQAMGQTPDVNVGEQVYVTGMLDQDFFSNREISANHIVTLSQDQTRANTAGQRQQEHQREQQTQQSPAN